MGPELSYSRNSRTSSGSAARTAQCSGVFPHLFGPRLAQWVRANCIATLSEFMHALCRALSAIPGPLSALPRVLSAGRKPGQETQAWSPHLLEHCSRHRAFSSDFLCCWQHMRCAGARFAVQRSSLRLQLRPDVACMLLSAVRESRDAKRCIQTNTGGLPPRLHGDVALTTIVP